MSNDLQIMLKVSIEEASTQLTELITAAREGQTVLIQSPDSKTVQLVPVPTFVAPKSAKWGVPEA